MHSPRFSSTQIRGLLGRLPGILLAGMAFTAAAQDPYEPDDTPATATPLEAGEVQRGRSLEPADDEDWVTFTLDGPAKVNFELSQAFDELGSAGVRLFDGNLNELGPGATSFQQTLGAGTYFGMIFDTFGTGTVSNYTLYFAVLAGTPDPYEDDETPAEATAIAVGQTQGGHTISPAGDRDWVTFTLAQTAVAIVEAGVPLGVIRLTLFDADGVEIDSSAGATVARVLSPLGAGTYYARVEEDGNNDFTAAYSVSVWTADGPDPYEPDDTPAQAGWLGNTGPDQARGFDRGSDEDWIRFYVEGGTGVTIETAPLGLDANPYIEVFTNGGPPAVEGPAAVTFSPGASGIYLMRITNAGGAFGPDAVYTVDLGVTSTTGIIPGTLFGVVRNAVTGAVVANALVEITDFGGLDTSTNASGVYSFDALPQGSYTVRASASGFQTAGPAGVNVGSGSTARNFDLQPDCDLPDAPTGVTASDGTFATHVQVTWNAVAGAAEYQVYRAARNNPSVAVIVRPFAPGTSFSDTGAPPAGTGTSGGCAGGSGNNRVFYWVTARDECGESEFSTPDSGFRGEAKRALAGALPLAAALAILLALGRRGQMAR